MSEQKNAAQEREDQLFLSRVEELCERAVRGHSSATAFLSPRQAMLAGRVLRQRGEIDRAIFWGGYATAERVRLLLFPDYVLDAADMAEDSPPDIATLLALAGEDDAVAVLRVQGSGYRVLTHRDYLGSLLALGLEREVLGDIVVENDHSAVLFCLPHMVPFLMSSVERIANDAVTVKKEMPLPVDYAGAHRRIEMRDTVASARLDCVTAALAGLSREAAQRAIHEGRVELDYETEERTDRTVTAPCVLSVRGVGKFAVRELNDVTKKGRLRLVAEKYV